MEDFLNGQTSASVARLVAGERSSVLANAPIHRLREMERTARGNTDNAKNAKLDHAKV